MTDLTEQLSGLRGSEFIEAVRALALISDAQDAFLRCGGCAMPAEYIGMQRCGAPGGPVCQGCLELHAQWLNLCDTLAEANPYCRHCEADVDRSHIYAVGLWDGNEVTL